MFIIFKIRCYFYRSITHYLFPSQESLAYDSSQKEVNHDILFREGLIPNTREVSYLPRLVVVDLKGSLGLLPEFGDLYEDANFAGSSKAELAAAGIRKLVHSGDLNYRLVCKLRRITRQAIAIQKITRYLAFIWGQIVGQIGVNDLS